MTQEELAHRAGMSVPYLSDIERGRSSPSLAMLADLARGLDMRLADLFQDFKIDPTPSEAGRKRPKDE